MSKFIDKKIIKDALLYVNNLLSTLEKYYYHNYEHTFDVTNRAIYLGKKEWLEEGNLELLALAWIFHDTWFLKQYDKNEIFWANTAENYLKTISYSNNKINEIKMLIMATYPLYLEPKSIMEKVIKDADMDILWKDNFFERSINLKKEIEIIKQIKIKNIDWYSSTLNLFVNHKFFTNTQIKERNWKKDENKKILENNIKYESN